MNDSIYSTAGAARRAQRERKIFNEKLLKQRSNNEWITFEWSGIFIHA